MANKNHEVSNVRNIQSVTGEEAQEANTNSQNDVHGNANVSDVSNFTSSGTNSVEASSAPQEAPRRDDESGSANSVQDEDEETDVTLDTNVSFQCRCGRYHSETVERILATRTMKCPRCAREARESNQATNVTLDTNVSFQCSCGRYHSETVERILATETMKCPRCAREAH